MSQFTVDQYTAGIEALEAARDQTAQGKAGEGCGICGDAHPVWECGRNPLLAIELCEAIAIQSGELHATLHELAGFHTVMGEQRGPAKVQHNTSD